MPNQNLLAVGDVLRAKGRHGRGTFTARVADIFPAGAYPGMTLEWTGYNPSTNTIGHRAQAFTTQRWQDQWEIIERNTHAVV